MNVFCNSCLEGKNDMIFHLKTTTYKWIDFLIIPFQCDALSTLALGIQKLLTALAAVFQVVILAKFIDSANKFSNSSDMQRTLIWLILLMVCVGWRRISFVVGKFFINRLRVNTIVQMGTALCDKRARLHFSEIENPDSWNLISRVCKNPEEQVRLMLQRSLNLMLYTIRILGILYILFVNVWWIAILTALLCIPLVLLTIKSGEKNYNSKKLAFEHERNYQYLGNILLGREAANERALFKFTEKINNEWKIKYNDARKIKLHANKVSTWSIRGGSAIVTLSSSFIAVALVFPTAQGVISAGMCVALITGMYDLVNMVGVELVKALSQLAQCREYLRDLSDFVALPEVVGLDLSPCKKAFEFEELEFINVFFKYPGTSSYLLNDLNFIIQKNGHYAFVGANGSGKTTITKLMTALYDTYEGNILVNKKELREYPQEEVKSIFCGVYQDYAKYNISVEENVLLGCINSIQDNDHENKVLIALKQVGLLDKVSELPLGLQTPLGKILEGGVELSEGQWQKLALARTTVSSAPLLILDEPTSAMDPLSESRMYEEFADISKEKTSIFISHRLGSTKLADTIFVLDKGTIVEKGNHNKLMSENGLYAKMYDSQRSWYR